MHKGSGYGTKPNKCIIIIISAASKLKVSDLSTNVEQVMLLSTLLLMVETRLSG